MKLKKGFELRDVCGENVLVAQGLENIDFSKIINLNESATYLWNQLQDKDFDVTTATCLMTQEYDVDPATAAKDVEALLRKWKEIGLIEE